MPIPGRNIAPSRRRRETTTSPLFPRDSTKSPSRRRVSRRSCSPASACRLPRRHASMPRSRWATTTETVSVTAEISMLKTDNAEQSINVSGDRINDLPLNFGGGGGNSVDSQLARLHQLAPGVSGTNERASVNGAPGGAFKIYLEGQDVTSTNDTVWTSTVAAASVETIGEFSMQTTNFSAEFGQVLGGVFNFTTKSGTNELHGSAYEYLTNEALDAHRPFTARAAAQPQARLRLQRRRSGLPAETLQRTQQDVLLLQPRSVSQSDRFTRRSRHRADRGLPQRRFQRGADRPRARDRSAWPADHGERHLRPAHDQSRQRTSGARSVPQQHHSVSSSSIRWR